jgi:hypothetical protein
MDTINKLTLCFIVNLFLSATVYSTTCPRWFTPPCIAYQEAKVVFVGVVNEIREEKFPIPTAIFKVERIFKGKEEKFLEVGYAPNYGPKFVKGQRYLIYAGEVGFQLSVNACSVSRKIKDADEHIEYLTALKEGRAHLSIKGILIQPFEDFSQSKVVVFNGKEQLESKIEKNGMYSVQVDKAASYNVKLLIPFEITLVSDPNRKDVKVTTTANSTTIEYTATFGENQCDYKELEIRYRSKTDEFFAIFYNSDWFESISKNEQNGVISCCLR